jgi:hypothetical protein
VSGMYVGIEVLNKIKITEQPLSLVNYVTEDTTSKWNYLLSTENGKTGNVPDKNY